MAFQINLYAIQNQKCFPIKLEDASRLNEEKADIYWTPNNFEGHTRLKSTLTEITSFYTELDGGDKKKQLEKLEKGPPASSIIETKNGYHCYWYLKSPIQVLPEEREEKSQWFLNLNRRIAQRMGGDPQASDVCRLLRMPMYRYWKDGRGTFYIDIALESDRKYEVEEIEASFPETTAEPQRTTHSPNVKYESGNSFWAKASSLPCLESLKVLSGTEAVNFEVFSFKPQGKLTRIVVNGKPSNAWIDEHGKIGSTDRGGPSVPNWLFWYHKDWAHVAKILKTYFPNLEF